MQAIMTRYKGPTDTRGSRIVASCGAGRLSVSYDDALGSEQNHQAAARQLAVRLGWRGTWATGSLESPACYVHVLVRLRSGQGLVGLPPLDSWEVA